MTADSLTQLDMVLSTLKVLLASLSVIFLFGFFIQWKFSKYRLPVIAFYTKKRFVKHNVVLGTGVVALSLAYIVDFLHGGIAGGDASQTAMSGKVIVGLLEAIGLVCIGYSYYKLMRLQIPT